MKKVSYFSFLLWTLAIYSLKAQTVTTLATGIGINDALIFDKQGNLFGSQYNGSAVFKLSPDGNITNFSDGFNTPNGLAFNNQGILYMADNEGNRIYKILSDGSSVPFIDNFFNPSGLIFSNGGDTLIATSYKGNRVVKIAPDSTQSEFVISPAFNGPVGMCYDDGGNLYLANFNDRIIFKINPQGVLSFFAQAPGNGAIGFIAYTKGYIYATLLNNHKIYRFDLEGNGETFLGSTVGSTDGDAATARFNQPNGIVASPSGDSLYVSEFSTNGRLRLITNLEGSTSATENHTKAFQFTISPNPAKDQAHLRFQLDHPQKVNAMLVDQQGKVVRKIVDSITLFSGVQEYVVDLSDLSRGMYYCLLEMEDRYVFVEKIVLVD